MTALPPSDSSAFSYAPPGGGIVVDRRVQRIKLAKAVAWVDLALAQRLALDPDPEKLKSLLSTLALDTSLPFKKLKEDRYNWVRRVEIDDRPYVLKHQHSRPFKTFAYHLARQSIVWRDWRGAARLAKCGVRTNVPLALVHHRKTFGWTQTLITPYVEGPILHEWLRAYPPEPSWSEDAREFRLELAGRLGQQLARFTAKGVVNRDYKANNLVLDDACLNNNEEPVVIDLAGVRIAHTKFKVFKMLRMLYKTSKQFGFVHEKEVEATLKALLDNDAKLAAGRENRMQYVMEQVETLMKDDEIVPFD